VDASSDSIFNLPTPVPKIPVTVSLSNPNYIFGQNISDRVEKAPADESQNGAGMLFSSSLQADAAVCQESEKKDGPSLLEDAARCQEQRAAKRKYEEVHTSTGEENEQNVLQVST